MNLPSLPYLHALGFRDGATGPHGSKTIMLPELRLLLAAVPEGSDRAAYRSACLNENALEKATGAAKSSVWNQLGALYAFDEDNPLFRNLRRLWAMDPVGQPVLALAAALCRDRLFRLSVQPVLGAPSGSVVGNELVMEVLRADPRTNMTPGSMLAACQRMLASWTQVGHLTGKYRKVRTTPDVSLTAAAYVLFIAWLVGQRGPAMFRSDWARLLDRTPEQIREMARVAGASGLLAYRELGEVVEVSFPGWLTQQEEELIYARQ